MGPIWVDVVLYVIPPLAEFCSDRGRSSWVVLNKVYRFVAKFYNLAANSGLLSEKVK